MPNHRRHVSCMSYQAIFRRPHLTQAALELAPSAVRFLNGAARITNLIEHPNRLVATNRRANGHALRDHRLADGRVESRGVPVHDQIQCIAVDLCFLTVELELVATRWSLPHFDHDHAALFGVRGIQAVDVSIIDPVLVVIGRREVMHFRRLRRRAAVFAVTHDFQTRGPTAAQVKRTAACQHGERGCRHYPSRHREAPRVGPVLI